MECRDFRLMLVPYADGDLPGDEAATVAAHLAVCAPCRIAREALGGRPVIVPPAPDPRDLATMRAAVLARAAPPPVPGLLVWLFQGSFAVPKPLVWGGLALLLAFGALERERDSGPPPARVIDEGVDVLALATLAVN